MKTKIYIADISPLLDEKCFAENYNKISSYRKEKVDKMKFKKDKALSLGASLLLKKALEENGIDDNNYFVDENSKPHIDGIEFSLSHSHTKVMCAVSEFPIGCDVELIKEIDMKIADRFFTENEVRQIDGSVDTFYRIWTLKESFMKVTGLGMKLPLNSFDITLGEKITIHQEVNTNIYSFFELNLDDTYKYSFCIENSNEFPEIITLNF